MSNPSQGALHGVRVIDFGQYIAGPLVGQLMADYGADVIRVDPPGGPRWNSDANAILQRGKRSITLDLKQSGDRAVAERLIDSADVVIENFRPGVMDRLGLGPTNSLARNPGLVYCSIPGFASDDPRAAHYATEGVVAAAAGLYPPLDFDMDNEPVVNTLPLASVSGALTAANSVAAALIARERGGLGQHVEVSLYDATYELSRLYNDIVPGHAGSPRQMGGSRSYPLARSYECQDGRWVRITWLEERQAGDFAKIAGTYERWEQLGIVGVSIKRMLADEELTALMTAEYSAAFKTQPAEYWERTVGPIADLTVIRSTKDWLQYDDHAAEIAGVITLLDPELGLTRQGGAPVTMTKTPAQPTARHALDSDRDGILAELDQYPVPQPAAGTEAIPFRTALEGIRAVDLTVLLAGPTACRLLAEYGAEVVHIGNPGWKGMEQFHFQVHVGKQTMLMDLKRPESQEIFRRLVEGADVISTNFAQSVGDRLGVGEDAVRQYNPNIVYSRIAAHGVYGPRAEFRGHEEIGQAATGALQRFSNTPQGNMQFFIINDDGTGHVAAFGILLALRHRLRTGEGQFVGSSLAQTCVVWQTPYMIDHRTRDWNDPGGLDFRGYGPLDRVYQGSDGRWFYLSVDSSDGPEVLNDIPGLDGIGQTDPAALQGELTSRFATESAQLWVERLNAVPNVGASLQRTMTEVANDPWALSHGLINTLEFPNAGSGTIIGPAPRLSRTPMKLGAPVGPPGSDARAIFNKIGMGDRIDEFIDAGVVVEHSAWNPAAV